jgi:radical SAM superfamily enzyme YgiQ (UPF0313 family)
MKILLCDLTHDTIALANEVFPLNIGFVGSYLLKNYGDEVNIELSKFIPEAEDLIDNNFFDVVAFSNYPWNLEAGLELSRIAVKKNPNTIIIFGGPNFPYNEKEQVRFLKKNFEIDAYIFQAGEEAFSSVIGLLLKKDFKARKDIFKKEALKGVVSLDKKEKRLYGGAFEEPKNLDSIPSPYLNGLLDKFFLDRRLSPMIQTNRGCPFSCTFCADGHSSQNKIKSFSLERVKAELLYIAERIDSKLQKTLFISDLNFGMFTRDLEIANLIADISSEKGYPKYIDATTGKNSKNRIIKAVERLSGSLQMTMAMQSTDQEVLKNIKRDNIRLDDYTAIMPSLKAANLSTYGEIILGLPGETLLSHLATINDLLKMKVDNVVPHSLMMLNGAELNTDFNRRLYKYETKFRVLTRDFSKIKDKYVIETEEVAVSTKDLTFEDYVYGRKVAFLLSLLNNPGLSVIINVASEVGLEPIELIQFILNNNNNNKKHYKLCSKKIQEFEIDTRNELWDSEDEMKAFYQREGNFKKLSNGEDGKNLIQSHVTDWISYGLHDLIEVITDWFNLKAFKKNDMVIDAINFAKAKTSAVFSENRRAKVIDIYLNYDLPSWLLKPHEKLSALKFNKPTLARFKILDDQYDELERQLVIFGKTPQGMSKAYIRIGPHTLWRRCEILNSITKDLDIKKITRPSSKTSSSSACY